VVPHPGAQTIDIVDCSFVAQKAGGGSGVIALSGVCGCPGDGGVFDGTPEVFSCMPVSVEETTWGRIKALYRN
jgi:hypothetical protein